MRYDASRLTPNHLRPFLNERLPDMIPIQFQKMFWALQHQSHLWVLFTDYVEFQLVSHIALRTLRFGKPLELLSAQQFIDGDLDLGIAPLQGMQSLRKVQAKLQKLEQEGWIVRIRWKGKLAGKYLYGLNLPQFLSTLEDILATGEKPMLSVANAVAALRRFLYKDYPWMYSVYLMFQELDEFSTIKEFEMKIEEAMALAQDKAAAAEERKKKRQQMVNEAIENEEHIPLADVVGKPWSAKRVLTEFEAAAEAHGYKGQSFRKRTAKTYGMAKKFAQEMAEAQKTDEEIQELIHTAVGMWPRFAGKTFPTAAGKSYTVPGVPHFESFFICRVEILARVVERLSSKPGEDPAKQDADKYSLENRLRMAFEWTNRMASGS